MRVHIAQYEAEERELLDGVVDEVASVEGVDDAGGAEPPPVFGGRPALRRHFVCAGQSLYADPVPEALRTHSVEAHELQHAFKVGDYAQQHSGGDARDNRAAPPGAFGARHIQDNAESAGRRHCGDERHRQVVGYVGGDVGEAAQHSHHPVAEVVVTDGFAAQPGVFGMAELRVDGRAEQRQIHGLFGVIDERVGRAKERPSDEERHEQRFRYGYGTPFALQEALELVDVAVDVERRCRRHHDHERNGGSADGGDLRYAKRPKEVCRQQDAKGFAEGVASIGKAWEQVID